MLTLVARTGQLGYLAALCTFHAPFVFGLVGQMHLASHPPCGPSPGSSCGPPLSAAPKLWTTTSQLAPLVLAMLMSTHLARPNPFLAADAGGLPFPGGLPGGLTRGDLEVLLHLPLPVCLYGWAILLHGDTAELWCCFLVAACAWCVRALSLLAAPQHQQKHSSLRTLRRADPPALCCGRTGRSRTGSEARSSQFPPRPCPLQALARHRPDLHRDAVVDRHVVPGRHRARVWLARAHLRREHIM